MLNRYAAATKAPPRTPEIGAEAERGGNDRIKSLLKHFGLRPSLVRLKVLDTLLAAIEEGQSVGVRGVHARLNRQETPISFLSTREVLKRLCDEALIELQTDKTYSLHPRTRQWLDAFDHAPLQ